MSHPYSSQVQSHSAIRCLDHWGRFVHKVVHRNATVLHGDEPVRRVDSEEGVTWQTHLEVISAAIPQLAYGLPSLASSYVILRNSILER